MNEHPHCTKHDDRRFYVPRDELIDMITEVPFMSSELERYELNQRFRQISKRFLYEMNGDDDPAYHDAVRAREDQ